MLPDNITTALAAGISTTTTSRYLNAKIYTVGGLTFQAPVVYPKLTNDPTDVLFTVTSAQENRLDIISFKLYATPEFWWVIALANDIIDPFNNPAIGTKLRCPTSDRIYRDIINA